MWFWLETVLPIYVGKMEIILTLQLILAFSLRLQTWPVATKQDFSRTFLCILCVPIPKEDLLLSKVSPLFYPSTTNKLKYCYSYNIETYTEQPINICSLRPAAHYGSILTEESILSQNILRETSSSNIQTGARTLKEQTF